jgi:hypothetical protein
MYNEEDIHTDSIHHADIKFSFMSARYMYNFFMMTVHIIADFTVMASPPVPQCEHGILIELMNFIGL